MSLFTVATVTKIINQIAQQVNGGIVQFKFKNSTVCRILNLF